MSTHRPPGPHLCCLLDLRRALLPVRALVRLAAEGVEAGAASTAAAAVLGLRKVLATVRDKGSAAVVASMSMRQAGTYAWHSHLTV